VFSEAGFAKTGVILEAEIIMAERLGNVSCPKGQEAQM
jgi:hypothetical protein